jgi:hypothetical protein
MKRDQLEARSELGRMNRILKRLQRRVALLAERLEKSESSDNTVDHIEAILRVTESLVPGEVRVEISIDPECPERASIVFHVVSSCKLSINEALERELLWQREIGRIAPDSRDRLRLFVE